MSEKRRDAKGRILRDGEAQRDNGQYMYRFTDICGKRQTVYSWKLVNTDAVPNGKRDCPALRDLEKQIQRDLEDRIRFDVAEKTTVNDLFRTFMEIRTDLRITTRCTYMCMYDKHIRGAIGGITLDRIRATDIQKLYVHMYQEEHLKPGTIQKIHSILYQLFENAVMDSIIRLNPAANVTKSLRHLFRQEPEKRHALTEEEQTRFIDYIYKSRSFRKWGNLFTVLLGTGMRIGEALGLRWCDCNFRANTISVNHALLYKESEQGGYAYRISAPKTSAGMRIIPMFAEVRAALLKERRKKKPVVKDEFSVDGYTGFIFLNGCGKAYTPNAIFDAIQDITTSYNREEYFLAKSEKRKPCYLPKMSAHILRHTFCTRLCENEPNLKIIQDVMGHKSIRTTMDIYNEATTVKKQASFQQLEGKIKLS